MLRLRKKLFERKKLHIFVFKSKHMMSKSIIYRIIQHAENRLGSKRRIGIGRKPKIMGTKGKRKLKVMFDQSDKISRTQAARSFKCSQQYICKTLKKYKKNYYNKKYKKKKENCDSNAIRGTKSWSKEEIWKIV